MATPEESNPQLKNSHIGYLNKGEKKGNVSIKHQGKPKKQVIPVIYIPGIFASRLEKNNGDPIWDPDSSWFMLKNLTKGILSTFSTLGKSKANWSDKQIEKKIKLMHAPGRAMLGKEIDYSKIQELQKKEVFKKLLDQKKLDVWDMDNEEEINELAIELYKVRRKRGWYSMLGEYITIMETTTLTEHPEFVFPTFGFGYDWRITMVDTAALFKKRIEEIVKIKEYPEYGELGKDYEIESNNKVIIVTHSMGSIVTRYASEFSNGGAKKNIWGVMHLSQPTTGAPILYRRLLMGTKDEKKRVSLFSFKSLKNIPDNVLNEILGTTPYHFVKTVSTMKGGVQLLPTHQHRLDDSIIKNLADTKSKNNWLDIQHNNLKPTDATNTLNIYTDVYNNERIGFFAYKRYDTNGKPKPYTKEEFKMADLSNRFDGENITTKPYNEVTAAELKEYSVYEYYPPTTPYTEDSYRLIDTQTSDGKKARKNQLYKAETTEAINCAKTFHHELKLGKHDNTYVIRSSNQETLINMNIGLNKDNILDIPLTTSLLGDGTVPLTSQEALFATKAKETGPVISTGKTTHSSMPKHPETLEQIRKFLIEVANSVPKKNAVP